MNEFDGNENKMLLIEVWRLIEFRILLLLTYIKVPWYAFKQFVQIYEQI